MYNKSLELTSNRSDANLLNTLELEIKIKNIDKNKEVKKHVEEEILDKNVNLSENISEVSANDYGYFTLKMMEEEENKFAEKRDGFIGMINKAMKNSDTFSLYNNNFAVYFNKKDYDFHKKKNIKLINNDFELVLLLGREENDFKSFKIVNPNDNSFKSLVISI